MDEVAKPNDDSSFGREFPPRSASPVSLLEPDLGESKLESRPSRLSRAVGAEAGTVRDRELRPPMGKVAGSLFGLASAVLYTLANIALRQCAGLDPFLVSAVKAGPTVLVLGPFLGWMLARGEVVATGSRMVPRFIAAALVGQFVGAVAFQISLGMIGLAVAVPITLGMMIIGAAVLGRMILKEPVRLGTAMAMLVLIASVVVLSLPGAASHAGEDDPSATAAPLPDSVSTVWMGSMYAAASGCAYAVFGTVMRQALTGGLSAPLTMFISGLVGTLLLWSITLLRLGLQPLTLVDGGDWAIMSAAGALNLVAFIALSAALKSLPVVAVNLLNASQVAMAAIAGIILFSEPVTTSLVLGVTLTMIGLGILAGARKQSLRHRPVEH